MLWRSHPTGATRVTWARGLLTLAALAALAVGVAVVLTQSQTPSLPAGTSYSYQDDGAQALYLWAEAIGLRPARTRSIAFSETPALVLVVQPESPITPAERAALDDVTRSGGTVVVAGDSLAARVYLQTLGLRLEPIPPALGARTPAGTFLPSVHASNRLGSGGAEPLLTTDNGDVLAARLPRGAGAVVAMSTADPLLNDGLRDPRAAAWVYETFLEPAGPSADIAFDEAHHGAAAEDAPEAGLRGLLVGTAPGRAVLFAAILTVLCLLWSGRRLGPPLPPVAPETASRSMSEHVQALAGLYRVAGQREPVREHFARRYRRMLARLAGPPDLPADDLAAELRRRGVPADRATRVATALSEVERAHSDARLVEAVARADAAFASLPGVRHSTLSGA